MVIVVEVVTVEKLGQVLGVDQMVEESVVTSPQLREVGRGSPTVVTRPLSSKETTTELMSLLGVEVAEYVSDEMGVNPWLVGTTDGPEVTVEVMVVVGLARGQRVDGEL